MTVEVVAGPDAGRSIALAPGRHVLGRARDGDVRIADAAIEAHHAVVEVTSDGATSVLQLAGRAPVVVDRRPVTGDASWIRVEHSVEIGSSFVTVSPSALAPLVAAAPPTRHAVLDRPDDAAAVASAVRAAAVDPGLPPIAPVVLGVGAVPDRLTLVDRHGGALDPAALPLDVQVALERAASAVLRPIAVDLASGGPVAIATDRRAGSGAVPAGVARSVLSQLAALRAGGADVRVISLLGHRLGGRIEIGDEPGHVVVVADRAEVVRALDPIDRGPRATVVLLTDTASPALASCAAVLAVGARWRARWTPDTARPTESHRLHARGAGGDVCGPVAA